MTEQDNTSNENEVEESSVNSSDQERSPRGLDSREATQRYQNWENTANLPDPDPQEGWGFRWVRTSLVGNSDNPNVSKSFRDGWSPCRLEDHPELQIHMQDHNSEWAAKGNIEVGGLLLCKMPEERAKAREKHFSDMAQQQVETVDNTYFKDQDSRMATKQVYERKSKTTFGKDS